MFENFKKVNLIKQLYTTLPSNLRFGSRTYYKFRKFIKDSEFYSREEFDALQLKYLKKIVNHAWNNIEGYRQHWSKNNFQPNQINKLTDISKIPFITKEIIRDNLELFSYKKLKNIQKVTTGGSTGIPFSFYLQRSNNLIELAFIHELWSRFYPKINLSTQATILRGKRLNKPIGYDPMHGLILSSFDLTPENIIKYLNAIESYKTPILRAYPSSLYVLASVMESLDLKLNHKFNAIMLGSENLYDFQKDQLEKIFQRPIVNWYGHGEKTVLAGYCEHSTSLHAFPQYGITEIVDNNGVEVPEGNIGEIVGTSFWNYATPFIRYRSMDYAEKGKPYCDKCNRHYQLITKIQGREHEFIVDRNKKLIALTGISIICGTFSEILQFRFYQDTVGKITFCYIKKPNINQINATFIKKSLFDKIGDNFEIDFKEVDEIKRTKIGKLMYLEQKLDVKKFLK